MEWKDAVAHLPYVLMCTDKRGRILLLNRELDGVRVGKSFLKFAASKSDILAVGRAAKESLSDGKPREVKRAEATDGTTYKVELVPYGTESKRADHLLIILGPPDEETETASWEPTRSPAAIAKKSAPKSRPASDLTLGAAVAAASRAKEGGQKTEKFTPSEAREVRQPAVLGPPQEAEEVAALEAHEVILIASKNVESLAQSFADVLGRRLKTRLWPIAQFEKSLESRGSDFDLDELVSPHSRLVFLGKSEFAQSVANGGGDVNGAMGAHWKIRAAKVRRAAIWISDAGAEDADELLGDLQFEVGQISMRAIPVKSKRGIKREIDPGVALAGAYLEDPGTGLNLTSTIEEQVVEYQYLYAIAQFLTDGLESLVS